MINAPASPREIKILIADDSSTFRRIIREILEGNGYVTFEATNGQEALDLAVFEHPDCVLLDVEMPILNGLEVCRKLRENSATSLIPIIFVSHRYTVQEISEGLRAGGDDYVIKPFSEVELLARVQVVLDRLFLRLHRSPLTGLPDEVSAEVEMAKRKVPYALCFLDLKDLESYNRRYGYDAGDKLLKQLARIANSTIQFIGDDEDGIYHCAEDNFLVITSQEKAERIASHLIERFDQNILSSLGSVEESGQVRQPISLHASIVMVNNAHDYRKKLREIGYEAVYRQQENDLKSIVITTVE